MLMSKLNLALLAALAIGTTAALAQKPTPLLTHSPDELVAVLKSSDSSQKDKVDACRQLSVIPGSPPS
jgi:hypothetical protein